MLRPPRRLRLAYLLAPLRAPCHLHPGLCRPRHRGPDPDLLLEPLQTHLWLPPIPGQGHILRGWVLLDLFLSDEDRGSDHGRRCDLVHLGKTPEDGDIEVGEFLHEDLCFHLRVQLGRRPYYGRCWEMLLRLRGRGRLFELRGGRPGG